MINNVFFERVARLVYIIHMHVGIVGINLAATFVHGHEHRLYAACRLRHKTCGACWRDGKAGNVAASVFHHVGIQLRVGILYSVHKRVGSFPPGIVNLECATLFCHLHR